MRLYALRMEQSTVSRGRPRSASAHAAIMTATRDLLREGGYEQLTFVDIAARAGVGKQTVYRRWASKPAIVSDCVLEGLVEFSLVTAGATGDTAEDLIRWLEASHRAIGSPQTAPLVRALTAAAATDDDAAARMAERFTGPLRDAIGVTLRDGIAAGVIRADADAAAVADILIGTLIYTIEARDAAAAGRVRSVVATIIRGVAA